jgi:mannose-6-phosphate isomerase-like protein (cupin superfamily)
MRRIILLGLTIAAAAATVAHPSAIAQNKPLAVRPDAPSLKWTPCPPIFPKGCEIALLHGDPARPNADVFLRVPGGYEIPPHLHSSAERMILVRGRMRVAYRGAEPAMLGEGSYAYGPAKLPHRASCMGTSPCVLFIAFEGPVDAEPFSGSLK